MNGYLHMAIQRIQDHLGYILVVARGDAKVLLLGTDNAPNRLIAINGASPLDHHVNAYRTDHYERIVARIKRRFNEFSEDGLGVWFHVDPKVMLAAVEEFDLGTGARISMGPLRLRSRAWVKGIGPGVITQIDDRGAIVSLDRPFGKLNQVIASRGMLKPHLRPTVSAQ